MAGKPLADKHGAPLRLIDPSRYGYKSAKLITSIKFVEEGKGSMACDIGPYYSPQGRYLAGLRLTARSRGPNAQNQRRRDHGVLMLRLSKRRFVQLAGLAHRRIASCPWAVAGAPEATAIAS